MAGISQVSNRDNAYYWKDGDVHTLHDSTDWRNSNATGIVAANGKLYIAGYYVTTASGNPVSACYWVVDPETGEIEKTVTLPKTYASPTTKSIAVDGTTVYITGTDSTSSVSYMCYWKDDGTPQQTVLDLETVQTGAKIDSYYFTGRFAVNNGNLYIPFRYYTYTTEYEYTSAYWDGSNTHDIVDPSYFVYDAAILNNTVYMAGSTDMNNGSPFYWAVGNANPTSLGDDTDTGAAYFIFVQNGSLRFYGVDQSGTCYWDAAGNRTSFDYQYNWNNNVVLFADGDNVLMSYSANNNNNKGYVLGGQSVQLYGPNYNGQNLTVTGIAVH